MTYGELKKVILEVVKEANVSGAVGGYNTPRAFNRAGRPFEKKAQRPKRPSHTKMFDYLEEHEQAKR